MNPSSVVRGFVLSAAVLLTIGVASATSALPSSVQRVAGGGAWKSDADGAKPPRRWTAEVTRESNDSIKGRITIQGHPLIGSANFNGQISGPRLSGTIIDDNGNKLGTFDGTITPVGVRGTFKAINGDHGWWIWNGPAPQ